MFRLTYNFARIFVPCGIKLIGYRDSLRIVLITGEELEMLANQILDDMQFTKYQRN